MAAGSCGLPKPRDRDIVDRMPLTGLLLATVVAADLAETTRSSTEFRGDRGDGVFVGDAPSSWTDEQIRWRTAIDGGGYSSPAVEGDQIWITTASEDGHSLTGLCLSLADGSVQWSSPVFTVASPREKHLFNSYASPSVALSPTVAYLSWGSDGLAAVDRETFAIRWVRRDLPTNHYRGPGSSPILNGDHTRLFQIYDGYDFQYVECLDAADGRTIWRTHRPHNYHTDDGDRKKAYATPLLVDTGGDELLIAPTSYGCFAYEPATGRERWRVRYDQFSTAARPVFDGERLYVTTGFGKGNLLAIRPGGQGDVTETHVAWYETRTMPSKPSPIVFGGRVYALNDRGVLITLDATTGERLAQTRLSGNYSASPILLRRPAGDAVLLLLDESGQALAVSPGDDPEIVAESRLDDGVLASPVAIGDRLLVRTRTELLSIGTKE